MEKIVQVSVESVKIIKALPNLSYLWANRLNAERVFQMPKMESITKARTDAIKARLVERDGDFCSICGISGVPLQINHIIPYAAGGTHHLDNYKLVCQPCNVSKRDIREYELTDYLIQLMRRNPDFRNVKVAPVIGDSESRLRADVLAEERLNGAWQDVYIEIKPTRVFSDKRLHDVAAQLDTYKKYLGGKKLALVFPGWLPEEAAATLSKTGVELWDLDYLRARFAREVAEVEHPILQALFAAAPPKKGKTPDELLIAELKSCKPGRTDWSKYQRLIGQILERLFCPPLSPPISELADAFKVNRRDFIVPNYADDGFWRYIRSRYQADYIVVDAKNYAGAATKSHALQLANYLKTSGAGLFGVIACRSGGDRGCIYTLRELWAVHSKLIIVLTDTDMEQMLLAKASGGQPEEIIRQKIEDFRLSM